MPKKKITLIIVPNFHYLNLLPAEVSETNHRTIMIFSKICYLLKSV